VSQQCQPLARQLSDRTERFLGIGDDLIWRQLTCRERVDWQQTPALPGVRSHAAQQASKPECRAKGSKLLGVRSAQQTRGRNCHPTGACMQIGMPFA
jgi:hypothetical protein